MRNCKYDCKRGCSECCNAYETGRGWYNKPISTSDKISAIDDRIESLLQERKRLVVERNKEIEIQKLKEKALKKLTQAEKEVLGL